MEQKQSSSEVVEVRALPVTYRQLGLSISMMHEVIIMLCFGFPLRPLHSFLCLMLYVQRNQKTVLGRPRL